MLCISMQVSSPRYAFFFALFLHSHFCNRSLRVSSAVWVALEAEGLGANLQHYNSLIDEKVASEWKLDGENWSLKAQLVFGKPSGTPAEKVFQPLEDRVKFFS
jgi:predicted oxidoreductase (fatty acid repression mutant protein)